LRFAIKEKHSGEILDAVARAETPQIANFYHQLHLMVEGDEKIVRSQALNQLIRYQGPP
jgi:hypothetical protein